MEGKGESRWRRHELKYEEGYGRRYEECEEVISRSKGSACHKDGGEYMHARYEVCCLVFFHSAYESSIVGHPPSES